MSDLTLRISPVAAPVRTQVAAKLRQAIIVRRFEPGQRLIERELCDLTGASRTPVREALRQLESEGLVTMVPNRGPVVAEVTPQQAAELYDVRAALEALAARRFTERASDEEIDALARTVVEFEGAVAEDGLRNLLEVKDRFYAILFEGARNGMIGSMLEPLHTRISYLRAASLSRYDRPVQTVSELQGIVAAIRRRDPDASARLAEEHVRTAAQLALSSWSDGSRRSHADGA